MGCRNRIPRVLLFISQADLKGRVVYASDRYETNQEISLAGTLPHGVYILRATHGGQMKVFKIVKTE